MVAGKLFGAAALATLASAAPTAVTKRDINTDVLQFALTLEHLEKDFYIGALAKFSAQDFQEAGYGADYYNILKYIEYDEETHVAALEAALTAEGVKPNAACTYNFPYNTVVEFITLSSVLEGVGTSAYLGAANLITNPAYLTVAGSILAVEALHTSTQRTAINEIPNANPFYTPLDGDSVFTLAAMFITACPSSNMPLPFTAFPTLQLDGKTCTDEQPYPENYNKEKRWGKWGHGGWPSSWQPSQDTCRAPCAGSTVNFTAAKDIPAGSFITFVNGLTVTSVPATISGMSASAAIPSGLGGQAYAFVTSSNVETTFDDSKVLFGPAVVEIAPAPQ